jgi:hypothetical protein
LGSIDIPSAYHSNWLDNARAKFDLNWRPRTDLAKLIASGAFDESDAQAAWKFSLKCSPLDTVLNAMGNT